MIKKNLCIVNVLFIILLFSCKYNNEQELYPVDPNTTCDTLNVTYSETVALIMQAQCNGCHSGINPSGGIKTDNYTDIKTLVDNGRLMGSIKHQSGYSPMPKGGQKLSECDIAKIDIWVKSGALNN
jgi:hypothetical protein